MTGTSNWQFGLIVAYVLPGFVGLLGLSPFFPAVAGWLRPGGQDGLGPPMYAVLAAAAIGLIVSCFRWALLDQLHHWTGISRPVWNDGQLVEMLGAFDYLVQNHFRYYEFCGNTLVAALWAYGLNRLNGTLSFMSAGTDLGMLIVSAALFAASRDALAKYYAEPADSSARSRRKGLERIMFNGNDHAVGAGAGPRPEEKPQEKQQAAPKPRPAEGKKDLPAN